MREKGTPAECLPPSNAKVPRCPEMSPCSGDLASLSCCHIDDPQYFENQATFYEAKDVFFNDVGAIVVGQNISLLHGGCRSQKNSDLHDQSEVMELDQALYLMSLWGHNYYHLTIEVLVAMFQVREFILANPTIPLMVRRGTDVTKALTLLDLESRENIIVAEKGSRFVAKKLYFPVKEGCGSASWEMWLQLQEFLLTTSVPRILAASQPKKDPARLQVVVGLRLDARRIVGFDKMFDILKEKSKDLDFDLVLFRGNETLQETVAMFAETTLFVGAHGAGLSNIIFMPKGGVLLELVPASYVNLCFEALARALKMEHHSLTGVGGQATPLEIDINLVVEKVAALVRAKGCTLDCVGVL